MNMSEILDDAQLRDQLGRLLNVSGLPMDKILSLENPEIVKNIQERVASPKKTTEYNTVYLPVDFVKSLYKTIEHYSDDDLKKLITENTCYRFCGRAKVIASYIKLIHCYTFSFKKEPIYPKDFRELFDKHDFRRTFVGISSDHLESRYGIRDTEVFTLLDLAFRTRYHSMKVKRVRRYTIPQWVYINYITSYNQYNHNIDISAHTVVDLNTVKDVTDLDNVSLVSVRMSKKQTKAMYQKVLSEPDYKLGYIVPQNVEAINHYIDNEFDPIRKAIAINYLNNLNEVGLKIGDFMFYISVYREQEGGRWSEIGVQFQNMTTELKKYALSGLDYHNYDIKKCHPTIITQVMKQNKLLAESIGLYANGEVSREALALEIFNSDDKKHVGLVKAIINGLIYGMSLRKKDGAFYNLLLTNGFQASDVPIYKDKVQTALQGLISDLKEFNVLLRQYLHDNKFNLDGKLYIDLPNQKQFCFGNVVYYNFLKFRYHFITSYESSVIQNICAELEDNLDCSVIVNMHDGLLTLGKIPYSVIDLARMRSIFTTFEMEEKPL